ncbi:MAG: sulfur carrier protein ThiS [Coriobacteriales bacterium]|jgi:sulfur carrier protein|nr:sulfur carrier protein ThiS [Coriobacteriales bacterium]
MNEKDKRMREGTMSDTIRITVGGEAREYPVGLTVAQLLDVEGVESPQYVTVAVNESFVASELIAELALGDGDEVEFFYFMGGGRC